MLGYLDANERKHRENRLEAILDLNQNQGRPDFEQLNLTHRSVVSSSNTWQLEYPNKWRGTTHIISEASRKFP
jgi:hypothetical protein